MKLENPVIKEREEIIYEKEKEQEKLNEYDVQSPLIDLDIKKAENYLNFIDDKINKIMKETNFDKSNLENESQQGGKSESEKMSFLGDSKSMMKNIKEKNNNESFKDFDINGSKIDNENEKEEKKISENNKSKKNEENKLNSEEDNDNDMDAYDNESMEENVMEAINNENLNENRVPEGIQILEYQDKTDKKSKTISEVNEMDMNVNIDNQDVKEISRSKISESLKNSSELNDEKNDKNDKNIEEDEDGLDVVDHEMEMEMMM